MYHYHYHYSYKSMSIIPGRPTKMYSRHDEKTYLLVANSVQAYSGFLSNLSQLLRDVNDLVQSDDLSRLGDPRRVAQTVLTLSLDYNLLTSPSFSSLAFGTVFNYIISENLQNKVLTDAIASYADRYIATYIRPSGDTVSLTVMPHEDLYDDFQTLYVTDNGVNADITNFFTTTDAIDNVLERFFIISLINTSNCTPKTTKLFNEIALRAKHG